MDGLILFLEKQTHIHLESFCTGCYLVDGFSLGKHIVSVNGA